MTSIRQRLQQDLQAPSPNLLKQALQDQVLAPGEYQQLKHQYAGNNPAQQAEFDTQFANFMEVNFNTTKDTVFGAKVVTFPDLHRAAELKSAQAKSCLEAGKFWDFEKVYQASGPSVQTELRGLLNRTMAGLLMNTEPQYVLAKDVLSSASSRLTPATAQALKTHLQAYEAFTGRGAAPVLGENQVSRCEAVLHQYRKQSGTPLLETETIQQVIGHTPIHAPLTRFQPAQEAELLSFLMNSSDPRLLDPENRFEKLVALPRPGGQPSYVDALTQKIRQAPGKNLDPATVMKLALQATNGDYGLAMLAAHNLLKYIAYNARKTSAHPDGSPSKLDADMIQVMGKLGNLRPNGSLNRDKMGPWYHFFGIQVLTAAYGSSDAAQRSIQLEHFIRSDGIRQFRGTIANTIAQWMGSSVQPSPDDPEKAAVDKVSLELAKKLFP